MSKAKQTKNQHAKKLRKFADGETVLILRPNLHQGHSGEVVGFTDGLHRVQIPLTKPTKLTSHWMADVPSEELESYL